MPRLLFVSHHFPPDVTIGSKRSRRIALSMHNRGWTVDVLAAKDLYMEGLDPALSVGLEALRTHRTHALNPRRWARWLRQQQQARSKIPPQPVTPRATRRHAKLSRLSVFKRALRPLRHLELPDPYIGWLAPALWKVATLPRPDVVLATIQCFSNAVVAAAAARFCLLTDYVSWFFAGIYRKYSTEIGSRYRRPPRARVCGAQLKL